jgi:hypothetical protein
MDPADGQLYSFSQGRQYYYNALTATSEAERKANLARMFRTLGDVMHIMQDMAQPQHTRNDSHGLPGSWYEVYTDKKREKNELPYIGATILPFATAREYFTDLAQFSSDNFVSAGTNFDEAAQLGYNLPVAGTPTDVPVQALEPPVSAEILGKCDPSKPCIMTFYPTNQTVENKRAAALSIFDQYLGQKTVTYTEPVNSTTYTTNRVFKLNSYTFDTALPLLIPRAVAYSAGILDYFFRGQIDMAPDTGNPGKYLISNAGSEDMSGNFALYYDAVDGSRYPVPGAAWSDLPVSANSQANNLSVDWPSNPAPQTSGEFTLVFNGDMGAEKRGVSSKGVPDSSIGAVVSKKVKLQCRSLSIAMTQSKTFSPVGPYVASDPNDPNAWAIKYPPATSVTSDNFTVKAGETWPWGDPVYDGGGGYKVTVTNTRSVSYTVPAAPSVYSLFSGSWWYYWVPPGALGNVFIGGSWFDYLPPAQAAANAENAKRLAEVNAGCATVIRLSDSTQLASYPYTILDSSGHKANYPISTVWSGNGWLDLYTDTNNGSGNWAPVLSQRVTFTVPSGVCTP